jgi:RNA polymerase sigma-70 factor (ECF subfamily)
MTAEEYSELFDEHFDAVFAFCLRRTADRTLSEDLAATVFLEAWRRRDQVDLSDRPALPWLFGVATNVLRNSRRAMRRHRAVLERIPATVEPAFAEAADARVDDERAASELREAVAELPRREREVLELIAWADLSYAEAAGALGVPIGTVRSRLSRARARLGMTEPALEPQEVLR